MTPDEQATFTTLTAPLECEMPQVLYQDPDGYAIDSSPNRAASEVERLRIVTEAAQAAWEQHASEAVAVTKPEPEDSEGRQLAGIAVVGILLSIFIGAWLLFVCAVVPVVLLTLVMGWPWLVSLFAVAGVYVVIAWLRAGSRR